MDVKQIKPISTELLLEDGSTIGLTLNFGLLYRLKSVNKAAYGGFFRAFGGAKGREADPLFDSIDVLYAAYCCHCLRENVEPMGYEDFLSLLPQDMGQVMTLASTLISPKKAAASAEAAGSDTPATEAE